MFTTETLSAATPKRDGFVVAGFKDILSALKLWKMFSYLGWEDIRQRYVRTFLGPMWMIVGTGILVVVMGFVMSALFGGSVAQTLPYIASGIVIWTFIANSMNDGCRLFMESSVIIHSVNLPISLYVFRFTVRNFIVLLHNFFILVVVFLCCHVPVNFNTLLLLPGLMFLMLSSFWVGALIGIMNTRYRDVQQIITNSMTVLPFVTPIYWERAFLKKHAWIANANPFYHVVEVVRGPLLGQKVAMLTWEVMIVMTALGLLTAMYLFGRYRNRIIFWV